MIISILNWIYVAITCYIAGSFALRRLLKNNQINLCSAIMCGFALMTAYAGYYSLFSGVGLVANILMLVILSVFVVLDRKAYADILLELKLNILDNKKLFMLKFTGFAIIIGATSFFTAYGKFAYDTGLYHAQSIRWIEEYGVVKGLAYMQTRLGFNSSYFCTCALFSFHDFGQSLHTLSGFLLALLMMYAFNGLLSRTDSKIRVCDFLYIAPFVYFVIIAMELISPTTDFVTILLIMWIAIRWIELIDCKETGITSYALLCVMAVFLVSIKLSVGVLALLVIKPAVRLIKEKSWCQIAGYIVAGILLILPYFIRNVLITGWLIYPMPAIDLFNVDWKIPIDGVRYESNEIIVWARYTKDVALIDQGIMEWFPVWWREQGSFNRYLSLSAFVAAFVFVLRFGISIFYTLKKSKTDDLKSEVLCLNNDYLYFTGIFFVSFVFFMVSAPSNRFGYSYILVLPLVVLGDLVVNVIPGLFTTNKLLRYGAILVSTVFILFGMFKGTYLMAYDDYMYAKEAVSSNYLVEQKDYPVIETGNREWEGINMFYPKVDGEQIWYHAFPATLYESNLEGIQRRGDSIRDGFKMK